MRSMEVLTPSQVNAKVQATLGSLGPIAVQGEVTNANPRATAADHWYFSLKDPSGTLACTWFRAPGRPAEPPRDGATFRLYGTLATYAPRSTYQLTVRAGELVSDTGALLLQYEQLKRRLAGEGLFDRPKKRLAAYPRSIVLLTSRKGAALRDILATLRKQNARLRIHLIPVPVQGQNAGRRLAKAVDWVNQNPPDLPDALILARGGGSYEELFCFSDEYLVRAIARSSIPVISAVGHQVDRPLSDEVADIRAPTPTAAAQLIVQAQQETRIRLENFRRRLPETVRGQVNLRAQRLALAQRSLANLRTLASARAKARINQALWRGDSHLRSRILSTRHRLSNARNALRPAYLLLPKVRTFRQRLNALSARLGALDPDQVLARGYSLTLLAGRPVSDPAQVPKGAILETRLARGTLRSIAD